MHLSLVAYICVEFKEQFNHAGKMSFCLLNTRRKKGIARARSSRRGASFIAVGILVSLEKTRKSSAKHQPRNPRSRILIEMMVITSGFQTSNKFCRCVRIDWGDHTSTTDSNCTEHRPRKRTGCHNFVTIAGTGYSIIRKISQTVQEISRGEGIILIGFDTAQNGVYLRQR
mmetsp:Transcript_26489/g.61661  ORF Transcript_26489/g.61661 Transcript_26489/m.61661 type:complete len:171 (+) Transcript_26489:556-1068(+)